MPTQTITSQLSIYLLQTLNPDTHVAFISDEFLFLLCTKALIAPPSVASCCPVSQSSGKLSEPSLTLPVEDSQDLYGVASPEVGDSQGPFSQEDTQSQLLDADGFLNVGPRGGQSRSHKRQLLLDNLDENAMDANMGELLVLCSGGFGSADQSQPGGEDELLGLCSGAFSTQPEKTGRPKEEAGAVATEPTVGESNQSSDTDMDQLLSLCSGKFTGTPGVFHQRLLTLLQKKKKKRPYFCFFKHIKSIFLMLSGFYLSATSPGQPNTSLALEDESGR